MTKSITFLTIILFGFPCYGTNSDINKRIRALEEELKNLKQSETSPKSVKSTKEIVTSNNDVSGDIVDDDLIQDEGEDLQDLLPLEENDLIPESAENSPLQTVSKVPSNDLNNKINSTANDKIDRASELYDQAKIMMGQKKLTSAKQIFQEIITAYPESPFYIIAYYWTGELALNSQDYMAASIAYGSIYEKYKTGGTGKKFRNRVAESLIKFSYCLKMLKKNNEACVIINEFYKEFKDVPPNITYFADRTHSTMTCPKT